MGLGFVHGTRVKLRVGTICCLVRGNLWPTRLPRSTSIIAYRRTLDNCFAGKSSRDLPVAGVVAHRTH